jgi:signal transduction histidine kinase/ActR/RegA family two-component response regulator/HPt (histidine-containing phosphotransfer) domain-containing protein
MKAALRKLFEHYRAHHEMDRPLLQWIGVVGCIAFPLFYVVRRVMSAAPGYDDLPLRLVAAALCLGLALRRRWPARLHTGYLAYSWFVVFYCLSFLLSYTMLRNHGGGPQVINMVVGAVLIILLADWRNAITMLLGGYILAALAHRLTDPQPELFREFIFAAGGSLLAVVGGALSHQGQKRVEINRMRRVYTGLAGSIAHEMRNPLAQVRHALDSIAATLAPGGRAADQQLNAGQVAAVLATVQQGREAVSRGLQAIELTLQQLHPAPMDGARVQTVSALACVRHAVDTFAYEDAGQRHRVTVLDEGDFRFRGDPAAMDLVLFNLLKNALYYLPLNPAMVVRITVAAAPVPRVVVHDSGPGIPDELMARLFQEFQTAGKAEGTGLGLSFCRRVMRALGGDIKCRSEHGRFTEFTLTFPPALANEPSLAPAPARGRPLAGRTVLVVDDQALNRAIARALARDLGLRTLEAEHGQQALDMLRSGVVPDAILMDVNMPGLDGIATARLLRELPGAAARVPVLALTANDSAAVQAAARAGGLHALLTKPIDAAALERALISALQGPGDPAVSPLAAPESELLNTRRVDDFGRLGLMDELPGALVDMSGHLKVLEQAEASGDLEAARNALHALVGLSGECGAQALHGLARRRYAALLDGQAASAPVATELRALLAATEQALALRYGVQVGVQVPS